MKINKNSLQNDPNRIKIAYFHRNFKNLLLGTNVGNTGGVSESSQYSDNFESSPDPTPRLPEQAPAVTSELPAQSKPQESPSPAKAQAEEEVPQIPVPRTDVPKFLIQPLAAKLVTGRPIESVVEEYTSKIHPDLLESLIPVQELLTNGQKYEYFFGFHQQEGRAGPGSATIPDGLVVFKVHRGPSGNVGQIVHISVEEKFGEQNFRVLRETKENSESQKSGFQN